MKPIRLMTLAPGHFHAALVQKRMLPGLAARNYIYAPLDFDTLFHVERILGFNTRPDNPTHWEVDLRAGGDWFDRFQREQPGNTVVLSGQNRIKIEFMQVAVANNLHVLADKPWIVDFKDFPRLEALLRDAETREVLVCDIMTERHEITNQLQREFIRDANIFGEWQTGSPMKPALVLESVHYLKKDVAGVPLVRPWWWFHTGVSGEAMADVGTHLADLAIWLVARERVVNYEKDIQHLAADGWPLVLSEDQFREVTNVAHYPGDLKPQLVHEQLYYAGNNSTTFLLGDIHVELTTLWEYEAPPGGIDTHTSLALGTKAKVEVRQPPGELPNVFVTAVHKDDHNDLLRRLYEKCEALRSRFPGMMVVDRESEAQIMIPDKLRRGHESHFAAVMEEFVRYFYTPGSVPIWERPNTLAKYFITTKAVEMAKEKRGGR